jgi:hypothetical protein
MGSSGSGLRSELRCTMGEVHEKFWQGGSLMIGWFCGA